MATKKTRKTRKRKTAVTAATLNVPAQVTLDTLNTQYQIFIGTVPYSKVCIGYEEFKAIYRGSELIWRRKD